MRIHPHTPPHLPPAQNRANPKHTDAECESKTAKRASEPVARYFTHTQISCHGRFKFPSPPVGLNPNSTTGGQSKPALTLNPLSDQTTTTHALAKSMPNVHGQCCLLRGWRKNRAACLQNLLTAIPLCFVRHSFVALAGVASACPRDAVGPSIVGGWWDSYWMH